MDKENDGMKLDPEFAPELDPRSVAAAEGAADTAAPVSDSDLADVAGGGSSVKTRTGTCPLCKQETTFTYSGNGRWECGNPECGKVIPEGLIYFH